jgi:hypothetical protein
MSFWLDTKLVQLRVVTGQISSFIECVCTECVDGKAGVFDEAVVVVYGQATAFSIAVLDALLKSDLIDRFHGFRRVKPRKSNLAWRSISSTSLSSVVT